MSSYISCQKLNVLDLLVQLSSLETTGCLQVSNCSKVWLLYLEQGKLTCALSSSQPFERLDRHLLQLSHDLPQLNTTVRTQVRLLFEATLEPPLGTNLDTSVSVGSDYRAICWLVKQRYLTPEQAAGLVEQLTIDVMKPLLALAEGDYTLLEPGKFNEMMAFCHLDLYTLVEQCQQPMWQPQFVEEALSTVETFNELGDELNFDTSPTSLKLIEYPISDDRVLTVDFSAATSIADQPVTQNRRTIACIDDSQTFLQTVDSFLKDANFLVLMIKDPLNALIQIVQNKPDLILLDIGMPDLDGYGLCSLLRRHPQLRNTPVIMVTGYTSLIDRAKARLAGASGYLPKPFTQSELLRTVFKHLK